MGFMVIDNGGMILEEIQEYSKVWVNFSISGRVRWGDDIKYFAKDSEDPQTVVFAGTPLNYAVRDLCSNELKDLLHMYGLKELRCGTYKLHAVVNFHYHLDTLEWYMLTENGSIVSVKVTNNILTIDELDKEALWFLDQSGVVNDLTALFGLEDGPETFTWALLTTYRKTTPKLMRICSLTNNASYLRTCEYTEEKIEAMVDKFKSVLEKL